MRVDVTVTEGEATNYGVEVGANGTGPVQLTLRANRQTHQALLSAAAARRLARALELAAEATEAGPPPPHDGETSR
ncbi:MAG: hypothetical protein OXG72_19070 [Acidobacteria bacterium]|nr:hypothetical protein [Acidobacteriota bacterium]